jgi:hypothetical protein
MPYLTVTLKNGIVLTRACETDEEARGELASLARWKAHRWGLPTIYWKTVDGAHWCFSATEVVDGPHLHDTLAAAPA